MRDTPTPDTEVTTRATAMEEQKQKKKKEKKNECVLKKSSIHYFSITLSLCQPFLVALGPEKMEEDEQ